jgi:hypothetical protein
MSDGEYSAFQRELLSEPVKDNVLQATGGLRKIRMAAKGKGKRGGARVIYYYFDRYKYFYLLSVYAKNDVSDLTTTPKKQLKDFMEVSKNEQT